MAGIYLHIPFCKTACNYCNFHFSTSLRKKGDLLLAIRQELILQKDYLQGEKINTIYFGGGTPSLLEAKEITMLIDTIATLHQVESDAEITVETNPDDLSESYLQSLKNETTINRLSIGIQSFFEEDLKFMNRAHDAIQAQNCISLAQDIGFENISIDLIYGTPTLSNDRWQQNIAKAIAYDVPHISSYCLTVEPKTPLQKQIKKGTLPNVSEEQSAVQFDMLIDGLETAGWEHYEISNFAKPDRHARHNSNYWLGEKYLGVGPSAHSYDGVSRQFNVANNTQYMKATVENRLDFEKEILTPTQRYNEYIMTTLRTKWGTNFSEIEKIGNEYATFFEKNILQFIKNEYVIKNNNNYKLNKAGKMLADFITSELFLI